MPRREGVKKGMEKEADREYIKTPPPCVLRKENIGEVSRSEGVRKEADREYIKTPPPVFCVRRI